MSSARARNSQRKSSGQVLPPIAASTEPKSEETAVVIRPQRIRQLTIPGVKFPVPVLGRVGGSHLSMRHWRVPGLVTNKAETGTTGGEPRK